MRFKMFWDAHDVQCNNDQCRDTDVLNVAKYKNYGKNCKKFPTWCKIDKGGQKCKIDERGRKDPNPYHDWQAQVQSNKYSNILIIMINKEEEGPGRLVPSRKRPRKPEEQGPAVQERPRRVARRWCRALFWVISFLFFLDDPYLGEIEYFTMPRKY